MISPASERSELAGAEERWHQPTVFRSGWRVCGRRSRTLSRRPGGAAVRPACRAARQRGGCVRQGASSPFRPSGMCGLRSRLPDIRIPLSSLRAAAAGFKEALAVGCVMCGLTDWSSAAGWPAAERREAHSSHLWAEGESAHGLPGAVSDEYGQFRSPLRDGLAPAR